MKLKFKVIKGSKIIFFAAVAMLIYGSVMVFSAEMGNSAGDTAYLQTQVIKQVICAVAGLVMYFIFSFIPFARLNNLLIWLLYIAGMIGLFAARFLFEPVNGAYAWIRFSSFTIQPSEFCKVFIILLGAKYLGYNHKDNIKCFKIFIVASIMYVLFIMFGQHDLGSAVVLAIIAYCICLIPDYPELKKIQRWMIIGMIAIIGLMIVLMSPPVTNFLIKYKDNYMVARFLAAANPFMFQYNQGYHLIMSLVSFAQGGLLGLHYGNSIHKYMNFPNPSSDFILPILVEELGIVGFVGFLVIYGCILVPLIYYSLKIKTTITKIVLLGTFLYFAVHFILNVGGVSGFIPLTGVPLLLLSAGGSSIMSCMIALGLSQSEIEKAIVKNENNSREV